MDGSNELGRGFFNKNIQKWESQVRFFFESKAERRVKRVEAVLEKIAFIFVAEYYEGVIHIAVIHLQFGSGLKKLRFIIANKNIGKGWSKGGSHGDSIDMAMHDVIEAKLNRRSSHLHKFDEDLPWKRCRRVFRTIESVCTDLNSLR